MGQRWVEIMGAKKPQTITELKQLSGAADD